MLLTFKTLDHKIFKYEVSEEDTVDDVKTRIEEDFGSENIYKLIYSGKIMKDDQQLKSYKINERQFVVLMITKPQSKTPNKEEVKAPEEPIKSVESPEPSAQEKIEDEIELESIESSDCEDEVSTSALGEARPGSAECEAVGLEWVEQQIRIKKEKHFLTNKDFTIALEVVMDMEYLADVGNHMKKEEDIITFLDHYFKNKSFLRDVKETVLDRLGDLLAVSPNSKQLEAFLSDLISIYAQEREPEAVFCDRVTASSENEDEEEECIEVIVTAFQRNVDNIVAMGFVRDEAEVALRAAFNNPDQAVDYLLGGIPPSVFAPEENPLAFLRNNPEFQHIRVLVQADPATLQPLLLSFGQQHPELMETINKNKLSFVRMLHEPDGAKGFGDDSSLVVDPAVQSNMEQPHSR